MPITREQFSRIRRCDLETAMARALVELVRGRSFTAPGGPVRLLEVYEEWPDLNDGNVAPAACVLPDGDLTISAPQATPALMEDTWERQGEPGFGLYKLGEGTKDFLLEVRASSPEERSAVVGGLEDLLAVDPEVLMTDQGTRYGVVVELGDYYRVPARFTLLSSRKLDDSDSAAKNIEEAQLVVRCDAPKVIVGPVQPFKLNLVVSTGEGPIP